MSAIGFAAPAETFEQIVQDGSRDAERFSTARGTYLRWSPSAGIELWMQLNAVQQIVGCNPHFAGQGQLDAAIIETVSAPGRPMDGHCFGWAAPVDPANPYSGKHAIAVSLPNFACLDETILKPPVVTLQIAAFASQLEYFPLESAFVESVTGHSYGAETGKFVWLQTEEDGLPKPDVFLSGFVAHSGRHENPITGQAFHALVVRTEAGTIDVVADLDTSPRRPVVGTVVAGNFWLSARVVSDLPPPRSAPTFQRSRAHS